MAHSERKGIHVLVTGGAGFIGSHLVDALVEKGAAVRVLDNLSTGKESNLAASVSRFEFLRGDLRDVETCREACHGVEVIFHEAALGSVPRSMKDPATTFDVNVRGTANLLAAARDAGVRRVVYASSSSVYGDNEELPKVEGREGRPLSPYALSKVIGESLADLHARLFGMEIVGLRYFNVFGPRQDPEGPYAAVVPRFIEAARSGRPLVVFGDGEQRRDFTFVADVVRANLLAAAAPREASGRAFNVGAGGSTSVRRLAETIGTVAGREVTIRHEPPRAGDIRNSTASVELSAAVLGFRPEVTLLDGLRRTWSAAG